MKDDTIKLLRECNAGIKMGVSSLDDVLDKVRSHDLKTLLQKSKATHTKLGNQTHEYLTEYHDDGKEPAAIAKLMAKVKTNLKLDDEGPDSTIAELITDGCNMGVKSLHKYINKYSAAEEKVVRLAKEVADAEETLVKALQDYL
ncbi:MAG: hypothetical protein ACI4FY_07695 [Acetatifactor sp.]